jgi:hypothetical protein
MNIVGKYLLIVVEIFVIEFSYILINYDEIVSNEIS